MKLISVKIDVTKIDKTRLYRGEKGTYLNAVIFLDDEADQYGNHGAICEQVTKEERQSGVKGTILGNVKVLSEGPARQETKSAVQEPEDDGSFDSLPF
jgi:hypothetical protein